MKSITKINYLMMLLPILILYTNMGTVNKKMEVALDEAAYLDNIIKSKQYKKKAQKLLKAHRRLITNYISAINRAPACNELFKLDPNMKTGRYRLYPEKYKETGQYRICEVKDKKIVNSIKLKKGAHKGPECIINGRCTSVAAYKRRISCKSNSNHLKKCNVDGVILSLKPDPKTIVGHCIADQTYYAYGTAIMVDKGCQATFDIEILPMTHSGKPAKYISTKRGEATTLTPKTKNKSGYKYQWYNGNEPIKASKNETAKQRKYRQSSPNEYHDGRVFSVEITKPDGKKIVESFLWNVNKKNCPDGTKHKAYKYESCSHMGPGIYYGQLKYQCIDGLMQFKGGSCNEESGRQRFLNV